MTPLALIPIGTIRCLMRPATDSTLQRLTRVPHSTRVALNITLERDMLLQRHAHNACTGGDIPETRKALVIYSKDLSKRGEGEMNTRIARLHREIMNVNIGYRSVRLSYIKVMDIVNLKCLTIKYNITVF